MYPHQAERLHAALDRHRLDALVATSPANVTYVTGFASLARHVYPTQEAYAVVTREGTALVVPTLDLLAVLESEADVNHVACHGRFHLETERARGETARHFAALVAEPAATAAEALLEVLRRLGVTAGRLGLDDALLPGPIAATVRQALGAYSVEPGSEALAVARMVKSPFELDALQRSLHVAEEAINVVLALLAAGITEREAAEAFEREIIAQGARPYCTIVAFGAGSAVPAPWPTDRALRAGDLVRFDLGCSVKGYHSDVARMAVMGEPTERQQTMFDAIHAGLEAALDTIRPGITAGAVFDAAVTATRKAGLARFDRHHVGYGIGLEPAELPRLAPGVDVPLEMGTVLRVETPYYVVGETGLNVKETVLVTRTGATPMNRSHRGLVVLD
jgi:Xaa-Pro aminopeptidase